MKTFNEDIEEIELNMKKIERKVFEEVEQIEKSMQELHTTLDKWFNAIGKENIAKYSIKRKK